MKFKFLCLQILFIAGYFSSGVAYAQTAEEIACLNDPACNLERSTETNPVTDPPGTGSSQDTSKPGNTFLMKHQGRLVGIPMPANDESVIRDYLQAPAMTGEPYWDAYGTGAYYVGSGQNALGNQLWHVNFSTQEFRQLTDGNCIPGVKPTARDWRCGYLSPVAHVPGSLAFIQQVLEARDENGKARIPETPQWQVVISVDGSATGVISLDSKPGHLSWSPDGEWLVLVEGGELLAISEAGKVCVLPEVSAFEFAHPEWTNAGGGAIVYEVKHDIWTVPVKKVKRDRCPELQLNRQQQLTSGSDQDRDPQWLEKSNLIAFISDRPLNETDTSRRRRIWAVQAGQTLPQPVVMMPFSIGYADWQISRTTPQKAKIGAAKKGPMGR